jgi:hypothetical protein
MVGGNIGDSRVKNVAGGVQQNQRSGFAENMWLIFCRHIQWLSFEMQNGLPSRMYELSITQDVHDSFQYTAAKYPCNYEVNDGIPDSIQVATAKDSSNEEIDNSNNSDPFNCDIMPSSSDEVETASTKYFKRKPDPSLRYWKVVDFYKTERALNN